MKYTRRAIWASDEDWANWRILANESGQTISALIRGALSRPPRPAPDIPASGDAHQPDRVLAGTPR